MAHGLSPTSLGGLGFGLKWDMGWMHDTLDYLSKEPVHRSYHHGQLTFRMLYAFTENYMLPPLPRRGGSRQGIPARQDARRSLAAVRQPAAALRLHVCPAREEAPLHGARR